MENSRTASIEQLEFENAELESRIHDLEFDLGDSQAALKGCEEEVEQLKMEAAEQ